MSSRTQFLDRLGERFAHVVRTLVVRAVAVFSVLTMASMLFAVIAEQPAAAAPAAATATLNVPTNATLGQNVQFSVAFDNTDTTNTGFGPYIDLFLPTTGPDGLGAQADDGLTFVSATYLGAAVTAITQTIATCPFTHPVRGTSVTCPSGIRVGDQFVRLELPFGSFTPNQPAATIQVTAAMSNFADVGTPMTIAATPYFRYGQDALDNSGVDPMIVGSTVSSTVTPSLVTLTKTYVGPEDETSTGPSFHRRYQITADIASGQTITNLTLGDRLANNVAFLSVISPTSNPGTIDYINTPTVGSAANSPNNVLNVRFASVSGGAGTNDAQVTFEYFVPHNDANAASVLDASTGDDVTGPDNATLGGSWTPLDSRDAVTPISVDVAGPEHTLNEKSIAIQKGASPTTVVPGTVVTYSLPFQVSDYFTFDQLAIQDTLGDGLIYNVGSMRLTVGDRQGSVSNGVVGGARINTAVDSGCAIAAPNAGRTLIDVDLSSAMVDLGLTDTLIGGDVAGNMTDATADFTAATGTLTFTATVDTSYRCNPGSGDLSIDQNDRLINAVNIQGRILQNVDQNTPTGSTEADTSSATVTLQGATLNKTVYARNGSTSGSLTSFAPGDTVTYRIRYNMPDSDFETLSLTDYLPLPVLHATDIVGPNLAGAPSAAVPAAGVISYGPAETYSQAPNSGPAPTISINAGSNSFTVDYGTFDSAGSSATVIDLLFTLTISNDPFADGLHLTNQVRATSSNSFIETTADDQLVQFTLTEPSLAITKGVIATDRTGVTYSPTTRGPVTFNAAPGSVGVQRWAGTISSSGLATNPVNSNITNGVDGGDLVTFGVIVENQGAGLFGAFDTQIIDTVPAGFTIPAVGATFNLQVTNGAGTPLAYTSVGGGTGLFDQGIELTDGSNGALAAYAASGGTNIAVITYNLQIDGSAGSAPVAAGVTLTNTATLHNYAATEGGPDFTTTDLTDVATVKILGTGISKTVTATSESSTTGSNVTIGELVDYTLVLTVPEGITPSYTVVDTLDSGLAFVSFTSGTASSGSLTTTASGGNFNTAGTTPVVTTANTGLTANGRVATFNFGTVTNSNTDNSVAETITLVYRVAVLNVIGNQNTTPTALNNAVTAPGGTGSAANVNVTEPILQVAKTASSPTADAGDTITFTLVVSHDTTAPGVSNGTAFNVTLTDDVEALLPNGFEYVAGTFANTAGQAPDTISAATSPVSATFNTFNLAATSTFTFNAHIPTSFDVVATGGTVTNTAGVTWSSLPGAVTTTQSIYNDFATERTGNTANPGGTTNDYSVTGSRSVTVASANIDKTLISTSSTTTTGSNVTIGENATYRLDVTVPEGTISSFSVTDAVPAGMAYVQGSSTNDTTGFGGTLGAMTVNLDSGGPPADGADIVFGFGNTVVTSTASGDETFSITFTLKVLDVVGNRGDDTTTVPNEAVTLGNSATVSVAGQTDTSSTVNATVVEPRMVITKAFTPTSAAANDVTKVTLVATNNGTSGSYETIIDDPVVNAAIASGSISAVTTPAGFTFSTIPNTPSSTYTMVRWTGDGSASSIFAAGASKTFEFNITLASTVAPPGTLSNTGAVNSGSTLPGAVTGERTMSPNTDTKTLTYTAPDIRVAKTDGITGPTTVNPDQTLTYTITVFNDGTRNATGVALTDTLPSTLVYQSSSASGALSGSVVTWPSFSLAAGSSTTRTVTVKVLNPLPNATSSIVNTANAVDDGTHGTDPTPSNNTATDTDITNSALDVAVAKTDSLTTVVAGQTVTYTITASNLGNQSAASVTLTDAIPANTSYVSSSNSGNESGGVVTWPSFGLAGFASGTYSTTRTVTVKVNDTVAAAVASITNSTTATAAGDADPSNNTATDVDTLNATPDLKVTKTDGVASTIRGATLTYTLTATNVGNQGATGVLITDTLDANQTYVSSSNSGVLTTGVVSWPTIGLAAGASTTRTVTVTVNSTLPSGTVQLDNRANVADDGANGVDPTPADNVAHDIDVTGADLSITKTDNATSAIPGTALTYVIKVSNAGPEVVNDVSLLDTLPSSLQDPAYAVSIGTYAALTGAWTGANLAVGGSATLTITAKVRIDATGSLINTATVDAVGISDPTPSNNSATDTDTIDPRADLTLLKEAEGTYSRGGTATYKFTVTNSGPSRANQPKVSDPLPTGLTLESYSGEGWTCVPTANVVDCTYASYLAPNTSSVFRLVTRVALDAPGEILNTASVSLTGALADPTPATNVSGAEITVPPLARATARVPRVAATGANTPRLLWFGGLSIGMGLTLTLIGDGRVRKLGRRKSQS